MTPPRSEQVTQLLIDYCEGDTQALDQLLPLIYDELRRLAHRQRMRKGARETLNTTALVHEAYIKLVNHPNPSWNDRTHFFRVAAKAIRQILVDYARKQQAAKRGGQQPVLSFDEALFLPDGRVEEVLALDEALTRLEQFDERQSQIVELRYFVGFTIAETADALDISPSTVKRDWTAARAWLHRELRN